MKPRVLIGLLVTAVVVIGLALWLEASRKPADDLSATGPALPGLLQRMETLDEVRISQAGNDRVATIKRGDSGWQLEERSYPADAETLRKLLLDLARAKRVEAKTSNPDLYAKLGVEDVSAKDAQGVQLDLLGGGEPLALIIGSNYGQGTGTYVRIPSEAQSWLINSNIAVDKTTSNWLKKGLIDVQPNSVASVVVTAGKDEVDIGRNEQGDFRVLNVPKGREIASDFVADATVGLLQGLRIDDVAELSADEAARPAVEREAKFELVDGRSVLMSAWQVDNKTWVSLSAALDETKADQYIAEQQAKEVAAWKAKQAAKDKAAEGDAADPAKDGESVAASAATDDGASDKTDDAPLAMSDAKADREAKLKALQDELAAWQASFQGRRFELPSFKAGNLNRKLEDYLKPKK